MTSIVESDHRILGGKPVFKGTRIPISLVFELLGLGYTIDEILDEYPSLSRKAILQSLEIGREALNNLKGKNLDRLMDKGKIKT